MIEAAKFKAMLSLLDDPDEAVVSAVESRFIEEGNSVIEQLEKSWVTNDFPEVSSQIESIIKRIQCNHLHQGFGKWFNQEQPDLLEGWIWLSKIKYPGIEYESILRSINDIRMDAWLMMGNVQNERDKIDILNHVFFHQHGFKGDSNQYHYPDNSFVNTVLSRKTGNPISLSALYITVAQSLGLPIFGVNLPQHFIVAYCRLKKGESHKRVLKELKANEIGKPVFYVNPYSKGQVFMKDSVDAFLKVVNVKPMAEFYLPCSVHDIIKRMLRNLHYSFGESQEIEKQQELLLLMKLCGMGDEIDIDESDNFSI